MLRLKLQAQNSNRLFVLLMLIVLVVIIGGFNELHRRQIDLAGQFALTEDQQQAPMAFKLIFRLQSLTALFARLLPGAVYNALPVLIALAAVPWLASRFIGGVYETKDLKEAHAFLQRQVFGMDSLKPIIIVREGKIAVGRGSFFDRVGGPGFIIVYNDSAVVLERAGRLTRVLGPNLNFLEPFERIWEVIDLRPQRWLFTDNAMTKDGIPIACDVDVTFKIDDRFTDEHRAVRVKPPVEVKPELDLPTDKAIAEELEKAGIAQPLPYTDEAVFNAATAIWVRIRQPDHKEQLRKWTGRVMISEVEGDLRNILARYRLDWLLQPPQPGQEPPRQEILDELRSKLESTLKVGNRIGAKLLDMSLGQISVKDERIAAQWIEAWQASWEQRAIESLAEGEAELASLQAAQTQAQAEMVLTLTEAIRPLVATSDEFSSYLLALRLVETLRWMAYDPFKQAFLPPEIMRTLNELENMLGKGRKTKQVGKEEEETSSAAALSNLTRMLSEGRRL
jgi:hypothetical protein